MAYDPNLIMATLRKRESGSPQGNYTIRAGKGSSASGAYQFIDPTWRTLTKQYGVGTQYPSAYMAPPSIQDEVARRQVTGLLSKGYGPGEVANVWYTGNPQGQMSASAIAQNNGLTSGGYRSSFERDFAKISGNPPPMNTSPGAMAPQGFTPEAQPVQPIGEPMQFPGAVPAEPVPQETLFGMNKDQFGGLQSGLGGILGSGGGQQQPQEQQQQIQHFGILGRPEVQLRQPKPFEYQGVQRRRRGLMG